MCTELPRTGNTSRRLSLWTQQPTGSNTFFIYSPKSFSKICLNTSSGSYCNADMQNVPLTIALLNLPKGKSLGRSKPATNS